MARHIFHPLWPRSWVVVAVASSSHRLSRTRRFINVVTSCRRYCRGVSVTTEADVAFLIKRSRRQGSLHCVRIVGGDVGKGLVLTTRRPASLYNPAVDQFQSTATTTTTTAIATAWRRESDASLDASGCFFETIEFSFLRNFHSLVATRRANSWNSGDKFGGRETMYTMRTRFIIDGSRFSIFDFAVAEETIDFFLPVRRRQAKQRF